MELLRHPLSPLCETRAGAPITESNSDNTAILPYGRSARSCSRFHITRRTIILAASALFLLLVATILPNHLHTRSISMCAVCGSTMYEHEWLDFYHPQPTVNPSPLDHWLIQHEGSHTHSWTGFHYSTFAGERGCGRPPLIHQFCSCEGLFLQSASDADIAQFISVMRTGTDQQQQQVIDRAAAKIFRDPTSTATTHPTPKTP